MRHTRTLGLLIGAALLIALPGAFAQDDAEPPITLTLVSTDALFQALEPGAQPLNADFVRRLDYSTDTDQSVIYVAIQNTGWSAGTVGLISEALDAEAQYVALEVDKDGSPRTDGLAFALVYDAELDEAGGFVLPVLIAQGQALAIFRVIEDGGLAVAGITNVREDGTVVQSAFEATVDAEPVFGALVLELHIVALPDLPPEPPDAEGDATLTGDWGACGSCNTCGHAGECVLDPAEDCVWNPAQCGAGDAGGGEDDGEPSGPSGGTGDQGGDGEG